MLIVVSGLPGTGKSAVAEAVAAELGAVQLSVDVAEDALLGSGLAPSWQTGVAAYETTRAAAEQNLVLGRTVVVDAVNDSDAARLTWVVAAEHAKTDLTFVLLTLDDMGEHRRRLESRSRSFSHLPEPTWGEVQLRSASYENWSHDVLHLSAAEPVRVITQVILEHLRARPRSVDCSRKPS